MKNMIAILLYSEFLVECLSTCSIHRLPDLNANGRNVPRHEIVPRNGSYIKKFPSDCSPSLLPIRKKSKQEIKMSKS